MLYILADDLTGASDAGIQFSKRGHKVFVTSLLNNSFWKKNESAYEVLSLNFHTRACLDYEAYAKTRSCLQEVAPRAEDVLIKKIDSLFRGNVFPELEALLSASRYEAAFITPAYPVNGRFVKKGKILGNDQVIDINRLVPDKYQRQVMFLSMHQADVLERVQQAFASGIRYFIFDSEDDGELQSLIQLSKGVSRNILLCGSAGLISAYASQFEINLTPQPSKLESAKTCLIVSGSKNFVTENQFKFLLDKSQVLAIELDPDGIIANPELERLKAANSFQQAEVVILSVKFVEDNNLLDFSLTEKQAQKSQAIVEFLSVEAAKIIQQLKPDILLSIGGDTTLAVGEKIAIEGIELQKEILPGIPEGKIIGGVMDGKCIITKSGAFGQSDALYRIVTSIERRAIHASN